jgi:lysophospholipid hydrolase
MQIFLSPTSGGDKKMPFESLEGEEDQEPPLLVAEIRTGGTVSSLFDILAIYSDHLDIDQLRSGPMPPSSYSSNNQNGSRLQRSFNENIPSTPISPESSASQTAPTATLSVIPIDPSLAEVSKVPSVISTRPTVGGGNNETKTPHSPLLKPNVQGFSTQSSLFARAATETTLLVIPESAFKKTAHFYPSSTVNMVQVLLSRFMRVTHMTLSRYLGLSRELVKIERHINYHFDSFALDEKDLEKARQLPKYLLSQSEGHIQFQKPDNPSAATFDSLADKPHSKVDELADFIVSTGKSSSTEDLVTNILKDEEVTLDTLASSIMKPKVEHTRSLSHSGVSMDLMGSLRSSKSQEPVAFHMIEKEIKEKVFERCSKALGIFATPVPSTTFVTPVTSGGAVRPGSVPQTPKGNSLGTGKNPIFSVKRNSISSTTSPGSSQVSLATHASGSVEFITDLRLMSFAQGSVLIQQGQRYPGIFYVIDGMLEAVNGNSAENEMFELSKRKSRTDFGVDHEEPPTPGSFKRKFIVYPGGFAGYPFAFSNLPSLLTIKARNDCLVGFIPKHVLDSMTEKFPNMLLFATKRIVSFISPLLVQLDLAMEWQQVNAGKVVYQQGDKESESIYVVLSGRLRSIEESDNERLMMVGEYGQGESIGELEVLTNSPRTTTVHAIRDTELACMPKTLFHSLAMRHPEITIHISRLIALRSRQSVKPTVSNNLNWKTIALIPENSDVPLLDFADRLKEAIYTIQDGSATVLDSSSITSLLGKYAFSKLGMLKLNTWLSEREEKSRIVIYVADNGSNSLWTQRCIRQADVILFLALGDSDPRTVGEHEKTMLRMKTTARKELVLLHSEHAVSFGMTRAWLSSRSWIHGHHHIQLPHLLTRNYTATKRRTPFEDLQLKLEKLTGFSRFSNRFASNKTSSFTPKHAESKSDFARLARRLLGKSIGLALGGGGARGIAHIGIIQAFEEAGIPIDMVGGCSIGSFIGGLYALNEDIWFVYWKAKDFSSKTASVWRQLLDLTYPLTSWFSGQEFNRAVWKALGDANIEDTWLNYFCVTTNITRSRLEVHTMGYIWRFIRASMSLSGFLPPLCDNGDMLGTFNSMI